MNTLEQGDKDKSVNNEEKKKTRRTRKDEEGRNYTCPCGKSYLSYPALYTHIKTKHQGKAPKQDGGVIQNSQPEEQPQSRDPLSQIKQILDVYFPPSQLSASVSASNCNPITNCGLTCHYPTPISASAQSYIEKVQQNWKLVKEEKLEDPYNNLNESINNILGRFLCEMASQVKHQAFAYLCELVWFLSEGVAKDVKEKDKDKDSKESKQSINGTQLVQYFNNFMSRSMEQSTIQIIRLDTKNSEQDQIKRGSPLNNSVLTAKVIQNLGVWMFEMRYTNYLAKFNQI